MKGWGIIFCICCFFLLGTGCTAQTGVITGVASSMATPMTTATTTPAPITYVVSGAAQRIGPVASYLQDRGCRVISRPGVEVMGSLNGKPWPGVEVSSETGSNIFIPVSDSAVKKGLCSDQKSLLDSLAAACGAATTTATTVTCTCDERSFSGRVTRGALREMGGGSGDIIEVHYRPGKSMAYKAKRGHVGTDAVFYPATWPDGSCMRIYSKSNFSEEELKMLLHSGESLKKLRVTDKSSAHCTIAVYQILR